MTDKIETVLRWLVFFAALFVLGIVWPKGGVLLLIMCVLRQVGRRLSR